MNLTGQNDGVTKIPETFNGGIMGVTTELPSIYASNLTLAVCFFFMGAGLLFLRRISERMPGPGYWTGGLFFNSAGFLCWAATMTEWNRQFFIAGELFHIIGFAALACGVFRFVGNSFKWRHLWYGFLLAAGWIVAMLLMPHYRLWGFFLIMLCRTILFVWAGVMILKQASRRPAAGRFLVGFGLTAWGIFVLLVPFIWNLEWLRPVIIGLPAGLHVMVVMGMVLLIIEQMQARIEASEERAQSLEGLLPICAVCKKIRDEQGQWHAIEGYIQRRSNAEFSHGICPECAKKIYPELDLYKK